MRYKRVNGQFKWRAFLFVVQHIIYFPYIIFAYHYTNKACKLAWWMMRWTLIIETWVRIPGPPKTL